MHERPAWRPLPQRRANKTMRRATKGASKLLREISSVTLATVILEEPAAHMADVKLDDEDGLHLLTARGRPYHMLL